MSKETAVCQTLLFLLLKDLSLDQPASRKYMLTTSGFTLVVDSTYISS